MRVIRPFLSFTVACFFLAYTVIGQTPTSYMQAAAALQNALGALVGKGAVNDVTLTGTVEWIAGSDDETGTVTYKGINGAYRLDMTFRNGTRSEIVSTVNGTPSGTWIGLDGTSHAIASQNMITAPGWFPAFMISGVLSVPNSLLTYVGQESSNGTSVIHLQSAQVFPDLSGDYASLMQHLTSVDIYIDPTSFLPISYVYNSYPDNNFRPDIPTEIRYSNYQNFNGSQIPLHVQKLINGTVVLDLQLQSAILNSGITSSQISTQ